MTDVRLTPRLLIFEGWRDVKDAGEKLVDTVTVDGLGRGDVVNTPFSVHIRTSLDVWPDSAVLCNSSV